jgi:hypothetical protein
MTRLDHLRQIRYLQAAIVDSLESTTPATTSGVEWCRERIELHRIDIEVLEEERRTEIPEPKQRPFLKGTPRVGTGTEKVREVGP